MATERHEKSKPTTMERLGSAVKGFRTVWDSIGRDKNIILVEAQTLKSLFEEEEGYRRISGGTGTGIQPYKHTQMQDSAIRIYRQHHMGRRLLQLIADFVIGDGVSVVAQHEDESYQEAIQDVIDTFWRDPVNAMDRKNEQRLTEWNIWGEICMPVMRNEATGEVRLGWITPKSIEDIIPDPVTGETGAVVVTDAAADSIGTKNLKVIRYVPDEQGGYTMEGDCFFYMMNTVKGGGRGISELYTASDWLDVLDNTLRAQSDRAKLDAYFIWDITLEGYTDDQVREWVRENAKHRPKPNTLRAHNERVTWKTVSPDLGAYEFSRHIKDLKTYIMGGFGYPNHWFGSGDDANLATAAVMSEPTRKNLKRKQKQFKHMMTDVVRYVLASSQAAGVLPAEIDVMSDPFEINIPDLSGPDIAKLGSAMTQIANAIVTAEEQGYISHDSAMELFSAIAAETGIEIDPSQEREKIEADTEKNKQETDKQALADEEDKQSLLQAAADAKERLEFGGAEMFGK